MFIFHTIFQHYRHNWCWFDVTVSDFQKVRNLGTWFLIILPFRGWYQYQPSSFIFCLYKQLYLVDEAALQTHLLINISD